VTWQLFVLERYESEGGQVTPQSVAPLTTAATRAVAAIWLPADEVVLVLVEAPDEAAAAAAAHAAGWRIDRLNVAVWITPATQIEEE
jgi:hypothetical protein